VVYKDFIDKITTVLRADLNLSANIPFWFFGFPIEGEEKFPYIAVKFSGVDRPFDRRSSGKQTEIYRFIIRVRFSNAASDAAEKSALDNAELVEAVLKSKNDLDGMADWGWSERNEAEPLPAKGNFAISGVDVEFSCEKRVTW